MIYFDNSATTKPWVEVIQAIGNNLASDGLFGNPGSLHKLGTAADKAYRQTFERAASCLGCNKDELYFTSCGTEGSNTAIRGFAHRNKRIGNTIISTKTEHKATLEVLKPVGIQYLKDWFGKHASIYKEDGKLYAKVKCNEGALRFWVLQYGEEFKLLSPESMVGTLKEHLAKENEKYS